MPSVATLPSITKTTTIQSRVSNLPTMRTIHDYLHIIHKSVDHFKGLRDSHPTLLLSKTVKPM